MNDQISIHSFLYRDPEAAVTAAYLANILHTSTRRVMDMVATERRQGWPICGEKSGEIRGYWLARTKEEAERYGAAGLRTAADDMRETAEMMMANIIL